MAKETVTVELSAKDRQLIRELIAAVKDAQIGTILSDAGVEPEDMADAKAGVKRLVEQSRVGFAEAARAEGGKFAEAARSLWNDAGPIYWGDEPEKE